MKHCTQCGAQLQDDSRFCAQCGCPAAKETPQAQNVVNGEHTDNISMSTQSVENAAPKAEEKTESKEAILEEALKYDDGTDLGKLKSALFYFSKKREFFDGLDVMTKKLEKDESPATGGRMLLYGIGITIIGIIFAVIIKWDFLILVSLIVGAVFCIVGIGRMLTGNKPVVEYQQKRAKLSENAAVVKKYLQNNYNFYPNCPVSYEYAHPATLELLVGYITDHRADNIKEAINCLVSDIHNAEMRKLQEQTAKNAEDAAKSARSARMYSAAAFINSNQRRR